MRLRLLLLTVPVLAAPFAAYYGPPLTGAAYWIVNFVTLVLVPAGYLAFVFRMGARAADIGLKPLTQDYPVHRCLKIVVVCTLIYLAYVPIANMAAALVGDASESSALEQFPVPLGRVGLVAIAYYALVAAVFEEIVFRGVLGFIFIKDGSRVRYLMYILCSAALFTALHIPSHDIPDLAGTLYLGLASAILYIRIRNVSPLIIAHFILDVYILGWATYVQ